MKKITMKTRVTLATVIIVTKYALAPICCWPPPLGASTSVVLRHNIFWGLVLLHLLLLYPTSCLNMYLHSDDIRRILKILTEDVAVTSLVAKMILCNLTAPHLQNLIAEMELFLRKATREENDLIQSYVDKCVGFHAIVLAGTVLGPLSFIAGPLILSQPLPGDAAFPFSIEPTWVFASMYLSQSICVLQVGSMVVVDMMFAILLWYTGARFQMLTLEMRRATNADDLHRCIQKHQELIAYAEQLKIPTSVMGMAVTTSVISGCTLGGFVLIWHPSTYEVIKYTFFELVSATELFIFAWPADNLAAMSEEVANAAFSCDWIGKSPEMVKSMLFVMQRSRAPIIITVAGILPALSLEFYGSTMAANFSYLTTLRAMILD